MLNVVDAREAKLRAEAAGLTKDSAIWAVIEHVRLPDDSGLGVEEDVRAVDAAVDDAAARLAQLSLQQQRLLVSSFGTYVVHGRGSRRVTVS